MPTTTYVGVRQEFALFYASSNVRYTSAECRTVRGNELVSKQTQLILSPEQHSDAASPYTVDLSHGPHRCGLVPWLRTLTGRHEFRKYLLRSNMHTSCPGECVFTRRAFQRYIKCGDTVHYSAQSDAATSHYIRSNIVQEPNCILARLDCGWWNYIKAEQPELAVYLFFYLFEVFQSFEDTSTTFCGKHPAFFRRRILLWEVLTVKVTYYAATGNLVHENAIPYLHGMEL